MNLEDVIRVLLLTVPELARMASEAVKNGEESREHKTLDASLDAVSAFCERFGLPLTEAEKVVRERGLYDLLNWVDRHRRGYWTREEHIHD